jgi:hypothetical protein
MFPRPMIPRVLYAISRPWNLLFSHLPPRIEATACGIFLASEARSANACSAVVTELPVGVFITTMPRRLAAGISTLSTPMPARPTTLSLCASSMTRGVT